MDLKIFKDDFLLVRGDIITNIDIHPALKMHYHVKALEADKKNMTTDVRKFKTILTKLFIKMPYSNPARDPQTDLTLLLDSQTKEIFRYESNFNPETKKYSKSFKVNEEYVQVEKSYAEKDGVSTKERNLKPLVNNMYPKGASLEIRKDLVDCEIAICTLEILETFTDNFDKSSLKDGFINWM